MERSSIPTSSRASAMSTAFEMSTPRRSHKAMVRPRSRTKYSSTELRRDSTELKVDGQRSYQVFYGPTELLQAAPPRLPHSPLPTAWKQSFPLRSASQP
ncbi:hypothetical protein AAC387_Pa02g1855 [Persea americana]